MLLRDQPHEIPLDLLRILVVGEPEPARDAPDVRIDDDAGDCEDVPEDHVRRLAADPREPYEVIHAAWNPSAVSLDHGARHTEEGARLATVESGRSNERLELSGIGGGELLGGRVPCEDVRRDRVDHLVRALGRQDRRDKQLVRATVAKLAVRIRVGREQRGNQAMGSGRPLGFGLAWHRTPSIAGRREHRERRREEKIMRMHVRIPVPGSNIELEGLVGSAPVRAVIAPPHPLYGGHLSNPVVTALRDGLARRGVGALAFNWRGVGASDGRPSGDADIAAADYASALAYVKAAAPQPLPWVAAGYSFGAATALAVAASDDSVREAVVVAPPVTMLPRRLSLAAADCRVTVIAASDDEFAPLDDLLAAFAHIPGARIIRVEDTDHFFSSSGLDAIEESAADGE